MPVLNDTDYTRHEVHGARFDSYIAPSSGSAELCAWRVEVEPGVRGVPHVVSHEEIFLVLSGSPTVAVAEDCRQLAAGAVVLVPAGSPVRLDNDSEEPVSLWVTTSVGLTATAGSGEQITPPWTR